MPIRHGGMLASRASIWPRDHFCRSTIAPRRSSPTTWNQFLPISMPIVALVANYLLDMALLRLTLAPSQHHSQVGQEHGRTIPLAVVELSQISGVLLLAACRGQRAVRYGAETKAANTQLSGSPALRSP